MFSVHLANNETDFSNFLHVLGLLIKAKDLFKGACHHFLVAATEIPEIVQLVLNMELFAISSMCEIGSEHKVCFGAFLRLTKVF
jgi:hypothetical protein